MGCLEFYRRPLVFIALEFQLGLPALRSRLSVFVFNQTLFFFSLLFLFILFFCEGLSRRVAGLSTILGPAWVTSLTVGGNGEHVSTLACLLHSGLVVSR